MVKTIYRDELHQGYLDLNKNEIRNARVQNLGTAPSSPVAGTIYYDTSTTPGILYWYNGSAWVAAQAGAASGAAGGDLTGTFPNPTIGAGKVTLAQMANLAANSILGNNTGSPATPLALTAAQVKTLLSIVPGDVTGFDTQVRTSRLDQMAAPSASVAFGSQRITGLADPSAAQDAATKAYVDSAAAGIDWKASVRVATNVALPAYTRTVNVITASANGALAAIDGVALVANDRVLVKNGAAGADNGIYAVTQVGTGSTPFILTRTTDADTSAEVTAGTAVFVEEGTVNADTGWLLTTDGAITLNTTALTFTQFTSLGQVTAGNGLTKTGSTLDVGQGTGISVAADTVGIDTTVVVRKAVGALTGGSTSEVITHNLNTRDVIVQVLNNATPWDSVDVEWAATTVNTATVSAPVNLPASYRWIAVG